LLTFAKEVGLTCPPTWAFHSRKDLIDGLSALPPQLVVKSASELHKFGPIYLDTEDSKARFLEFGVPDEIFESSYLLVQTQIRGPGVGFFALYQNGVCKRMFMHERLREMPATGGSSWAAKGMYSARLADQGLRLLDSLNWHGPAMVEFKKDSSREDEYSLMELNPKFWGSLDLAIESGVDFASDTVRVALGEKIETRLDFDSTKFFVWPLENLREYIKDKELHQKSYRTNVKLADLLPNIHQLLGLAISHVHGIFGSTIISTLLFWWRKHTPRDFRSRVVGQMFGLPLREHCKITDNFWVGARPSPLGRALLLFKGFDLRVSLLETNSKFEKQTLPELLEMPMEEFSPFPSPLLHKYALEVLNELQSGRKIFLHCREGVGRAPGLAIAVLLLGGESLEDATRTVSFGRKVISLNENQASSLVEFEEYIRHLGQT
jgi:hypothetical protein